MYRVPQAGPRRPAVAGPVVQRGVRPQFAHDLQYLNWLRVLDFIATHWDSLPLGGSAKGRSKFAATVLQVRRVLCSG